MKKTILLALLSVLLLRTDLEPRNAYAFSSARNSVTHRLLLIGGGKRPKKALQAWVKDIEQWAKARPLNNPEDDLKRGILILTWAAEEDPIGSFTAIREDLEKVGAARFLHSVRAPEKDAEFAVFLEQLRLAKGVFFSGGDQARILNAIKDERMKNALEKAYWELGIPFGGTSAGTAVMSERVIRGPDLPLERGFDFLPGTIVDQHHFARPREPRLTQALQNSPRGFRGVGVGEGSSIYWTNAAHSRDFHGVVLSDEQKVLILEPVGTDGFKRTVLLPGETLDWELKDIE